MNSTYTIAGIQYCTHCDYVTDHCHCPSDSPELDYWTHPTD